MNSHPTNPKVQKSQFSETIELIMNVAGVLHNFLKQLNSL